MVAMYPNIAACSAIDVTLVACVAIVVLSVSDPMKTRTL